MDISRQALVDTAVGVFGEAGWDGIGPQTLVRRLGVAPGAVYRHFKSRDTLMAAVLSRVQEELFVHIEASCPVVPGESGLGMLLRLGEAYCRFWETRPRAYLDILRPPTATLLPAQGESARELGRVTARVIKQFEVLLLLGRLDGSVRTEATAETARRIVSVLVGTVHLHLTPSRTRAKNLTAMLTALVGARTPVRAA